ASTPRHPSCQCFHPSLQKIFGIVSGAPRLCKRVDFSRAIAQGAWVAVSEENVLHVPHAATGSLTRRDTRWLALALAVTASALLAIRLDLPAFFDNEGRYTEVAREMMLRHDWISPHLDFTLFLNKPPLTFWLTAAVFSFAGPTEWARVVPLE